MSGSGIAYRGIIEMFPSSELKILKMSTETKKYIVVSILECFLTKGVVIFYHFKDKDFYEKFLEVSGWNKLPVVNQFGARKFSRMEVDKFIYD